MSVALTASTALRVDYSSSDAPSDWTSDSWDGAVDEYLLQQLRTKAVVDDDDDSDDEEFLLQVQAASVKRRRLVRQVAVSVAGAVHLLMDVCC